MKKIILVAIISGVAGSAISSFAIAQGGRGYFQTEDIRFDESDRHSPTTKFNLPDIPKSWQFLGVAQAGLNGNNLYFRDKSGAIFIVQLFESRKDGTGTMWVGEQIRKLNVDPKK